MTKPSVTEIDKLIGQRLKTLRQQHKVSAAALAEVMETSQQQISRYERGLNRLSGVLLWQLAGYFGVPVLWFFMDLQDKVPASPFINEPSAIYDATTRDEQIAILNRYWPQLDSHQRQAVVQVADAFFRAA